MPGFQYSSSPPSTPNRSTNNAFSFSASTNPSTTPAGPPPPSSVGSFTPIGPPPSSFYGSSNNSFGYSQQSTFHQSDLQSPNFSSPIFSRPPPKAQKPLIGNNSGQPRKNHRSPSPESGNEYNDFQPNTQTGKRYDDSYSNDDDGMDEDAPYEDEEMDDYQSRPGGSKSNRNIFDQRSNSDRTSATPAHLRQSKGNLLVDFRETLGRSEMDKPKPSDYAKIAQDLSNRLGIPDVDEDGDLILKTEAIITKLYEEGVVKSDNEQMLQRALETIPSELMAIWKEYEGRTSRQHTEEYAVTIGPGTGASEFSKARYLAHLALEIHHSKPVEKGFEKVAKPLPEIMLAWLEAFHNPFPHQLQKVATNKPSPSAHHLFWNTIHNNVLRGRVVPAVNVLKAGGWRFAWQGAEAINDQGGETGFSGVALANVEKVVEAAVHLLFLCPGAHDDWNIRGSDWILFRLRVSQALEDLRTFAEGGNTKEASFEPDGFGKTSSRFGQSSNYSRLAKKAASKVPWSIYQNLVTLYNILLGDSVAIIENAQDWCEATIALLAWRDEAKDERRLAPGRSMNSLRMSTMNETDNDLRRLRRAFHAASGSGTDFHVNTVELLEVGLACLFEGDNEAVITAVQTWSLPVASALAEVGSLAGWIPRPEPQAALTFGEELGPDDMDVLGAFESAKPDGAKDLTLCTYAKGLWRQRDLITMMDQKEIRKEGWEMAIAVLGRLDSIERAEQSVQEIVNDLNLDSAGTVDKLWRLLNDLGMSNKAETVALKYADSLAVDTYRYGEALWYYALAHNTAKVKDVLDTLISFCLVYSTAYPPESELDDHLERLLSFPHDTLTEMSSMDLEAAELVHTSLSGYATIRKFYTLRDAEINLPPGTKPSMGPIARKLEAANALLAVIMSSDDNIRGGLYDSERKAIIPIDYILALLGEALPFIDQPNFLLSSQQIHILLRTIEDIQSVGPRIYTQCKDFVQTVIAAGSARTSNPNDLLRKSSGGLDGSFELAGSEVMASKLGKSVRESGTLMKRDVRRGWDWREFKGGRRWEAEDLLRVLRLGLARDLGRVWLREVDEGA